ncbi:hypothetical protein HNR30_006469 [Nonomuraea soli]|uniref:Uncharacterized protein n=1 Tax=Nonomuraea soli TaxID=1032476 RepID=A0A7W0CPY6_9ACTN|nr:hypothetical protein [Nonomuraea soli]
MTTSQKLVRVSFVVDGEAEPPDKIGHRGRGMEIR